MGSKYTSQTVTGYNANPPPDDGSTIAANQVKWSTIKTKLDDVLVTWSTAINNALITALDVSNSTTSVNYTTVAGDHLKPIQVTGNATISLGDAATMGIGYQTSVVNQYSANITVNLATVGNTLNTVANGNISLPPGASATFAVNQAGNGYVVLSMAEVNNTGPTNQVVHIGTAELITGVKTFQSGINYAATSGTDTYTATLSPAITSYVDGAVYFLRFGNANTLSAPTINLNGLGAKTMIREGSGSSTILAGGISAAYNGVLMYNGTNMVLLNSGASGFGDFLTVKTWSGVSTAQAFVHNTDFDFTAYDEYWFQFTAVTFVNNANYITYQVGTGAGPTYDTGNNYGYSTKSSYVGSGAVGFDEGANSGAANIINNVTANSQVSNSSNNQLSGWFKMIRPRATAGWRFFKWHDFAYVGNGGEEAESWGSSGYKGNVGTVLTGIRFSNAGGNWAGTIRVYGVRNS